MSDATEWHRQYGEYFVVLKDKTDADWFVVIKRAGQDNIARFQLAGDLDDAQATVSAHMLREFNASPTSDWKTA